MNSDTLVGLLGGGGVGVIIAAVIAGLFSRRKLGAEATQIITEAASGVVTRLEGQLERSDKQMRRVIQDFENERAEWIRVLQLHVSWDHIAIAKVNALSPNDPLPPAPPVYPPNTPRY